MAETPPLRPTAADSPNPSIKVERETPLETAFRVTAWVAFCAALFLFLTAQVGGKRTPPNPAHRPYAITAALIGLAAVGLRLATNNYLVLKPYERRLDAHRGFLGLIHEYPLARFEELHCLTLSARHRSSRRRTWWEYRTVAVDRRGRLLPLGDWASHESGRQAGHAKAEELAAVIGARVVYCPPESILRVRRSGHTVEITHTPWVWWQSAWVLGLIVFGVLMVVWRFFLV